MRTFKQIANENGIVITIKAYDMSNRMNPHKPIPCPGFGGSYNIKHDNY